MTKAVFLDRDGVINAELGEYVTKVQDFKVLQHAVYNIKRLNKVGVKVIVITNQGGIAKGLYSIEDLDVMHQYLAKTLQKEGAYIDDLYFCPHHPETGICLCRKPGSLLVERAIAKHGIEKGGSLFIGDRQRDIEAAIAAGIEGVLIESNSDWTDIADEFIRKISQ